MEMERRAGESGGTRAAGLGAESVSPGAHFLGFAVSQHRPRLCSPFDLLRRASARSSQAQGRSSWVTQHHNKLLAMGGGAGRGKFKGKPTGRRHFSTPEEMAAGTSTKPRSFKRNPEEEEEESEEEESEEESEEEESAKKKGTQGVIQIENPNLVKAKNVKAKDVDMDRPAELSRREREELEKQKAHERYLKLQEQGKTEQSKKDLERLALIRQQRLEAAKKREEEKAAKDAKKVEARK